MDILIESFLIFTALMFWIMFYNKKGLLAQIKQTERKITEKIIVLEDLLDVAKESSVDLSKIAEPRREEQNLINVFQEPKAKTYENTEVRVLSLNDFESEEDEIDEDEFALITDFDSDLDNSIKFKTQNRAKKSKRSENQDLTLKNTSMVQGIVLEAKENYDRIDVSEVNEVKSFKDLVLISKKIEQQSK